MLEPLSKMWSIEIKTYQHTLKDTKYHCIRSTGPLTKRLSTDNMQLWYIQIYLRREKCYVDYLKIRVKYVRGCIGGSLYTNNLEFKKFFLCSDETSEQTGLTLNIFIELSDIPPSIHSDNHNNSMEGIFMYL